MGKDTNKDTSRVLGQKIKFIYGVTEELRPTALFSLQ